MDTTRQAALTAAERILRDAQPGAPAWPMGLIPAPPLDTPIPLPPPRVRSSSRPSLRRLLWEATGVVCDIWANLWLRAALILGAFTLTVLSLVAFVAYLLFRPLQ